jgi:RNA polymerase sigma-70 factor, ECF subfamily
MSYPSDRSVELTATDAARDGRQRFEALCLPYKADLYRFVFWLCRNRTLTEDVMQETLLRAWRSIDSLGDEKAARSWLLTIARRELARTFERKRLDTVELDAVIDSGDPALVATDNVEVAEMRSAIMQLDANYREPLVMQVLFGYSTEQIAAELNVSVAAVLTRLYRARQLLRKKMLGERVGESDADELP